MTTIRPGTLDIHVVADASGRTRAARLHQRYPQRVTTPLHIDPDRPGAAMLCVQSPSGGTFSDDDLTTAVRCGPGTELRLTTQAATQVFAGDGPGSRHNLSFTVDAGAHLEYRPGTVIPHAGSTFTQLLRVDVDTGGLYLGWDAVAAGRIAHGERFRFACYDNAFVATVDGHTVARDRQLMEPRDGRSGPLIEDDYLATFIAVAPGRPIGALLHEIRRALDDYSGGAGALPAGIGVFVRLGAPNAPALIRVRERLFEACRAWSRSEVSTRAFGQVA
ncbi:urease accessory protein UreD [Mycobacterium sp. PSTR-4-N]|uniref:urease accessory protein UreD n=1 Tax=Mycobacterium sp. PSTR-4-N TaxID=2917745 RepID=UPI001F15148A|nr:urease accessory protein UreD [Mycobacterium sp. PSTR-4-N]MCG7593226.1 urease accessory protein UreD [Mycobacterium sp. PSTR-4-N]